MTSLDAGGWSTSHEITCQTHMLRHLCRFDLANRGYDLRLIQDYLRARQETTELGARWGIP